MRKVNRVKDPPLLSNSQSVVADLWRMNMPDISYIKKRALVIEDEPIIGRLCRKILSVDGFEVDIAFNGLIAKDMTDEKSKEYGPLSGQRCRFIPSPTYC